MPPIPKLGSDPTVGREVFGDGVRSWKKIYFWQIQLKNRIFSCINHLFCQHPSELLIQMLKNLSRFQFCRYYSTWPAVNWIWQLVVKFVKRSALNSRLFAALCADVGADHKTILFHMKTASCRKEIRRVTCTNSSIKWKFVFKVRKENYMVLSQKRCFNFHWRNL
jgi:hypothetical protein